MKKQYNIIIRIILSFILSFSLISGGIAIISFSDPSFTISLIDLLSQFSVTAWLLLLLCAGIAFALLTRIPIFLDQRKARQESNPAEDQQSD